MLRGGIPHFKTSQEIVRYHFEQSNKKMLELEDKLIQDFSGITYIKQGRLRKKNVDLAFVGLDAEIQEVKHLNRKCINEIAGNDLLAISKAIVNTINHILITEQDVDEYEKKLLSNLGEIFGKADMKELIPEDDCKKQLVMEFLMALGYAYDFAPHKDIEANTR